jgi:hypothetical protein
MIAQVFETSGPAVPPTDEMRQFAEDALAEGRNFDGNEGVLFLADPTTGKALVINLFRDRAAMDAFQDFSNAKIAEVEERGEMKVAAPDVYTEVTALL